MRNNVGSLIKKTAARKTTMPTNFNKTKKVKQKIFQNLDNRQVLSSSLSLHFPIYSFHITWSEWWIMSENGFDMESNLNTMKLQSVWIKNKNSTTWNSAGVMMCWWGTYAYIVLMFTDIVFTLNHQHKQKHSSYRANCWWWDNEIKHKNTIKKDPSNDTKTYISVMLFASWQQIIIVNRWNQFWKWRENSFFWFLNHRQMHVTDSLRWQRAKREKKCKQRSRCRRRKQCGDKVGWRVWQENLHKDTVWQLKWRCFTQCVAKHRLFDLSYSIFLILFQLGFQVLCLPLTKKMHVCESEYCIRVIMIKIIIYRSTSRRCSAYIKEAPYYTIIRCILAYFKMPNTFQLIIQLINVLSV